MVKMSFSKRSLKVIGMVVGVILIVVIALVVYGGDTVRTITLDDGASISIPRGAVSSDASVNATILAPENGPEVPNGFTIETLYEFNIGEPLSEPVTIQLPLASVTDDSVLWVAKYDEAEGVWHGVGFTVEDDYAVIQADALSIFGTIKGAWDDFANWATETDGSVYQWARNEILPLLTLDHWISQFEEIAGLDKVIYEPLFTTDSLIEYNDSSSKGLIAASARVLDDTIEMRIQNRTTMYLQLYFEGPSVEPVRGGYLTLEDVLAQLDPTYGLTILIQDSFLPKQDSSLRKSVILLPESTADFHAGMGSGDTLQIRSQLSAAAALLNALDPFFALVPIVDLELVSALKDVTGAQSEFYQELSDFENEWFERIDAGLNLRKEIERAGWQLGTKGLKTIANGVLLGAPVVTELADKLLGRIQDILDKGSDAIAGGTIVISYREGTPTGQYNLTISSSDGGSVTVPGEGTYSYNADTVVSLEANPSNGYLFANWAGDVGTVEDVNDGSTTITMNGDYSIIANFEKTETVEPGRISSVSGKLSPDWQRIAFEQSGALWVSNLDGTHMTQAAPSVMEYAWSSTGTRIVYYRTPKKDAISYWATVGIVNRDGSNNIILYKGVTYYPHYLPVPKLFISPDEEWVFCKMDDDIYYIVPSDGSTPPVQLHAPSSYVTWEYIEEERLLSWTPTSNGIVAKIYIANEYPEPSGFAIAELGLDGGIKTTWFSLPSGETAEEVISPDLRKLAFEQLETGLSLINIDGTNLIETGITRVSDIFWSRDSEMLACLSSDNVWAAGQGEYVTMKSVWVMTADGTGRRKIIEGENIAGIHGWNPSGSMIAYTVSDEEGIFAVSIS